MRFQTLNNWLQWQQQLHPREIDLGLGRISQLMETLGLAQPAKQVITVAGTNGKGSTVAMLESVLLASGYRVGCYLSPHLLRYNERIRVNGQESADESICRAFERIDQARGDTSLSYFEFATLAAFDIFSKTALDVVVLEVGLGGRLDAVNAVDADVAIITTIDIDHSEWLGNDRESIGGEKAGILRRATPAVCGDADPPRSLLKHAEELGVNLARLGQEFGYRRLSEGWQWFGPNGVVRTLPMPALRGAAQLRNAAGVVMALAHLAESLPVAQQHLRQGLLSVQLPGRFQVLQGDDNRLLILDVAHNPQAAADLAASLSAMPCVGKTLGVVGMLADKDIPAVLKEMERVVNHWFPATLDVERGAEVETLLNTITDLGGHHGGGYSSVSAALQAATDTATEGDRIVVFGSFYTVADATEMISAHPSPWVL